MGSAIHSAFEYTNVRHSLCGNPSPDMDLNTFSNEKLIRLIILLFTIEFVLILAAVFTLSYDNQTTTLLAKLKCEKLI